MEKVRNFCFIIFASIFLFSCRQNQEKPGGYQRGSTATEKNSNGFDDLVADYESRDRLIWQKPEMVIKRLGDLSQKTVVDLGAGTGFFAFRIVSKAKRVLAQDIDQRFINFMDSAKMELPTEYRIKFETRLGEMNDPKIRKGEADAVIIVNTYMYIQNRVEYMKKLRAGLAKNAMILIVDYKEKKYSSRSAS
ncbi:MAG: class I SAM-dependent methyltransferase [Saprospiraceae bacterium]|nr:class I SAM-dependent methyltransferase [Saprospiraceae bacterium]